MKKLIFALSALVLASCATENESLVLDQPTTADRVATVMETPVDPSLDEVSQGLYKGLIASYDLTTKGDLVINVSDRGTLEAAADLLKTDSGLDSKIYFEGFQDLTNPDVFTFTSDRGSFDVVLNDDKSFIVEHFQLDGKDSYLIAYKKTRGVDITIAFGTYVDDLDATFTGNWDAIHKGQIHTSPAGGHSTAMATLLLIDEIAITNNGNMYISSDTPADNDGFEEPCFYTDPDGTPLTVPHAWYYENGANNYREFIGYNQSSTFAGREATWNLAYYLFGGSFFYDTPSCGTTAATGYGNWSWDGRAGRIFVDTLTDI